MLGKIARLVVSLLTTCVLLLSCTTPNQYTYEKIVAEYDSKPLRGGPTENKNFAPDLSLPSQPVDMEQAITIALHNNPEVEMAVSRIRQSEAMVDEANAAFRPALNFYTEYLRGDAPSAYAFKRLDGRQLPLDIDFNEPGSFQNFESGWVARYNLFRGGKDILRRKMAQTGTDVSRLDLQTVQNALIASVIQSYYTTLAARDFITIAKESVDTVSAQLRTVQVRYEGGSVLKSEVLSLEVRLAQAKADLIKAQNHYKLSLAALANLLGADADTGMELSEAEWQPSPLPPDYESGVLSAVNARPELLKVRQQIVSSKMALDMERSEYLPVLDLQAKTYFDDKDLDYDTDRANWTLGVFLNWDFFTGFSTRSRVEKARAILDEMLAADRKTTQSIQLDVKTAYLRGSEAEARLETAKAGMAQAEEALRLVKSEYEGGSSTVERYLDVELARNVTRMEETSALYDLKKAQADVCRAVGCFAGMKGISKE